MCDVCVDLFFLKPFSSSGQPFVHFQFASLKMGSVVADAAAVVCRLCALGLFWYLLFFACKFIVKIVVGARARHQMNEWKFVNFDCLLPLRLCHSKFITRENAIAMQCDYSTHYHLYSSPVSWTVFPAIRTIRQNKMRRDEHTHIYQVSRYEKTANDTCVCHANRFENLCVTDSLSVCLSSFQFRAYTSNKWDQTDPAHVQIHSRPLSLYLRVDIEKPPVFSLNALRKIFVVSLLKTF